MARNPNKMICVPLPIHTRLKEHAHYGQTLSGVIQELLDIADMVEGKPPVSLSQPKANSTMAVDGVPNNTVRETPPVFLEDKTTTKPDKPQYADE